MDGNGYCTDSDNRDNFARRYYKGMSHENAREICGSDEKCVAYTYSLDFMTQTNYENVVIYSSNNCAQDCGSTQWQDNPSLIKQARNVVGNVDNAWVTGKCYKKRSLLTVKMICSYRDVHIF